MYCIIPGEMLALRYGESRLRIPQGPLNFGLNFLFLLNILHYAYLN